MGHVHFHKGGYNVHQTHTLGVTLAVVQRDDGGTQTDNFEEQGLRSLQLLTRDTVEIFDQEHGTRAEDARAQGGKEDAELANGAVFPGVGRDTGVMQIADFVLFRVRPSLDKAVLASLAVAFRLLRR